MIAADVRVEVTRLHQELVRWGLVVWTGGNVSARVPNEDLMVIKPSGVSYEDLERTVEANARALFGW